jgi:quercetin dioxygenase-like cupin family protein
MGVQLPRLLRLRLLLSAASASGFKTQPLLKSGQTRDKQPIAYPKTDKPEIISVIGIIEPGGRTPLHEHPVPTYVYVLEGEVELQSHGGQPHQYKAGEAYIEALNHQHQHSTRATFRPRSWWSSSVRKANRQP